MALRRGVGVIVAKIKRRAHNREPLALRAVGRIEVTGSADNRRGAFCKGLRHVSYLPTNCLEAKLARAGNELWALVSRTDHNAIGLNVRILCGKTPFATRGRHMLYRTTQHFMNS